MKKVDIISKVVGRDGQGKPVGGGISIPMGNYALKSDFESLKSMFNDFLDGDDTDSVINRWKDLESFLNGISEDSPLTSILGNYIPIGGYTEITGEKNFTGGLKVNGSPIYYDTEKKYWKLEGDLLVTGGVTMYGNDSGFVASTIMDGIVVDGTTISKEGGILKVIGSVGGATTMGSLSNVGSWADSVAPQDRIMYQAANSSQWVAKNLSDLAVGGVTGDYLPLNMTSTPFVVNTQSGVVNFKSTSASEVGFRLYFGNSNKGGLWANDERIYLYHAITGNSVALTTGGKLIFNAGGVGYTVLHSENYRNYALPLSGGTLTGSLEIKTNSSYVHFKNANGIDRGSLGVLEDNNASVWKPSKGWKTILDADNYSSYALPLNGGTLTNTLTIDNSTVGLILHRSGLATPYIRFGQDANNEWGELGVSNNGRLVFWPLVSSQGGYNQWNTVWHSGNDGNGSDLDADLLDGKHYSDIINDNVASATKLQTARTIWGQSFDGTGNVSGFLENANFIMSNNKDGYFVGNRKDGVGSSDGGLLLFSYANNPMSLFTNSVERIRITPTGNVGIGTTNPTQKLHIAGPVLADAFYAIGGIYGWNADTSVTFNNRWGIYQWGNLLQITQRDVHNNFISSPISIDLLNGRVAILKQQPTCALDVSGDILASGGITMYSDARKKTILNHVELSLKQIAEAPLIEHYYNSDLNKTTHVGSIAQYWAEMNDWFCKEDSEGYLTMEIQNAALASAISVARELVKFESETDRRIRLLEDENKRLKEEVEQLKWNIA